jgi:hypothetical protein
MKTIKVVVERWLEIPDEWQLVEPEYTGQVHVKAEDHYLVPELTWLKLKDHSEETCGWEEADSAVRDRLGNMMVAGASSVESADDEPEDEPEDA